MLTRIRFSCFFRVPIHFRFSENIPSDNDPKKDPKEEVKMSKIDQMRLKFSQRLESRLRVPKSKIFGDEFFELINRRWKATGKT